MIDASGLVHELVVRIQGQIYMLNARLKNEGRRALTNNWTIERREPLLADDGKVAWNLNASLAPLCAKLDAHLDKLLHQLAAA